MGGFAERGEDFSEDGQTDPCRNAYVERVVVAGIVEELSPSHYEVPKSLNFNPWAS